MHSSFAPWQAARLRMMPTLLVLVLAIMRAPGSDAAAQQPRREAELWGHITTAGDSAGVPGATIELAPGRRTTSTATGFYRLANLGGGVHSVTVRRLGFRSVTLQVTLEESNALRQDVTLEPIPQQLTEVRIEGTVRKVPPRFEDVYRRMSTAWGSFFTREDIERMNPPDIRSILEHVGTVRVTEAHGIQFAKCNEGGNLALSPGGGKVQIYIDGLRMTGRVMIRDADAVVFEQREVLRMVNPSQIQAIEVYSGSSRIPGQFLEDACAVIAIWTKSY